MSKIAIYTHDDCLLHDTGAHPENAPRITAINEKLKTCDYVDELEFVDASLGLSDDITLAHTEDYFKFINEAAKDKLPRYLDGGDTIMSDGTFTAALRAVGAGCDALDQVIDFKYKTAFCSVRPPGHHSSAGNAMGFCVFNNIAITALHAIKKHGLKRVAIMDFDVHHGNGTQDIFEDNPQVLYISTHQSPFYPGTGRESETGVGNIVNVEFPAYTDGEAYKKRFSEKVIPALNEFKPEILLVSAGFDAHKDDPVGQMSLTGDDFNWIGVELNKVTQEHCDGKVISMLEGGYNHQALAVSVVKYLRAFL